MIPEPFEVIAQAVKIDVDTLLQQIKDWKETGLIRRFGASEGVVEDVAGLGALDGVGDGDLRAAEGDDTQG